MKLTLEKKQQIALQALADLERILKLNGKDFWNINKQEKNMYVMIYQAGVLQGIKAFDEIIEKKKGGSEKK